MGRYEILRDTAHADHEVPKDRHSGAATQRIPQHLSVSAAHIDIDADWRAELLESHAEGASTIKLLN
jgi:hypothetical protein